MSRFLCAKLCGLLLAFTGETAHAVCQNWAEAQEMGSLDHKKLPEASGIARSQVVANRIYHINDAGSSGHFYMTDMNGKRGQLVKLAYDPEDTEDLAVGSCDAKGDSCLFIADIGDNEEARRTIRIVLVREKEKYDRSERPLRILELRYPDGAHNAEGFAIHPNGDMFIVTKGEKPHLYKLAAETWQNAGSNSFTLERLAALEIASLSAGTGKKAFITSFDIAHDGASFLLMTNSDVFEVALDLATVSKGLDTRQLHRSGILERIDIENLAQQEAIAYGAHGMSFFYSSESKKKDAPLMYVKCND